MTTLTKPTKKGRDWTAQEIMDTLYVAGWTLRQLALHHHISNITLRTALYHPYPRCERRIAEALGLPPQVIWPTRYTADGQSNRGTGRPKMSTRGIPRLLPGVIPNLRQPALQANVSTPLEAGNVETDGAE